MCVCTYNLRKIVASIIAFIITFKQFYFIKCSSFKLIAFNKPVWCMIKYVLIITIFMNIYNTFEYFDHCIHFGEHCINYTFILSLAILCYDLSVHMYKYVCRNDYKELRCQIYI